MSAPILYIVLPCYNEGEVLNETAKRLEVLVAAMVGEEFISRSSKIVFVDDGSRDNTWALIEEWAQRNTLFGGVKLAHNAGHQNALLAGLEAAEPEADCVITVDADLQDDINVIRDFVREYRDGAEVVYGVRNKRDTDTWFKRMTAQGFYKLMHFFGVDVVFDHADYRLLGKQALDALARYEERNVFLRGIVPLLGFKTAKVYYERNERFAGESKYPLKKMIAFAIEGITSFSVAPIKLVTLMGFVSLFVCFAVIVWTFFAGETVPGWTSIMLSIWGLGGAQLVGIGLIGEYIGKIYKEVKRRPRYHIERKIL